MVFSKLPRRARVRKTIYPINYKKKIKLKDEELYGVCFHYRPRIDISIETKSEMESTLIHELIHAISCRYDLGLSEKKVLSLEAAIYSLFIDNGWTILVK